MATTINTKFQLKRGAASSWARLNPILSEGEPGFVYDTHRLKIGDGIHHWNDLPYIDNKSDVENYDWQNEFPKEGDSHVLYRAIKEMSLYQYNPTTATYEKLSDGKGIDNITMINGGNA